MSSCAEIIAAIEFLSSSSEDDDDEMYLILQNKHINPKIERFLNLINKLNNKNVNGIEYLNITARGSVDRKRDSVILNK